MRIVLIIFMVMLTVADAALAASITLDSGHSATSPGATSCGGKSEHIFNRQLTDHIANHLAAQGINVSFTHVDNRGLSLIERAAKANGKDLLLSIHHDSVQPQFVTRNRKTNGVCSDKATGFSIFVSAQNSNYQKSLEHARALGNALVKRGLKPTLHHAEPIKGENRKLLDPRLGIYQFDDLVVLKRAAIPAVLLEAGVIVNPVDEAEVVSAAYRDKIAESVLEMLGLAPAGGSNDKQKH